MTDQGWCDQCSDRGWYIGGENEQYPCPACKGGRKARRAADMPPEMLEMLTEEPPR